MTSPPDVSSWDTSSLTDSKEMFRGCSSLTDLPDISGWDISALTTAQSMFSTAGADYTTTEYDALLNAWAAQAPSIQSSVLAHFNTSQYTSAGQASRNTLVTTYSWTITDGGMV